MIENTQTCEILHYLHAPVNAPDKDVVSHMIY